jgi:transposase
VPTKVPPEFKRDVVAGARKSDLPIPEVAADFGIAEETAQCSMRQAENDKETKHGLATAEQEVARLRRANRRLEREHQILMQAAAYRAKFAPPK